MKPPPFTAADKAALDYEIARLKHTRQLELGRLAEVLGLELNEALQLVLEDAGWHRWVSRTLDIWKNLAASNEILHQNEMRLHDEADRALKDVLRVHRLTGCLPPELVERIELHLGGSAPLHLDDSTDG